MKGEGKGRKRVEGSCSLVWLGRAGGVRRRVRSWIVEKVEKLGLECLCDAKRVDEMR